MRKCSFLLLFGLAACGTSGTGSASPAPQSRELRQEDLDNYRMEAISPTITAATEVTAPLERVWAVLPQVFQELGIGEAGVIDPAGFVYGQREMSVRRRLGSAPLSQFVECGNNMGISNANSYTVTLSVVTQLQRTTAEKTGVLSLVQATARQPGNSQQSVVCTSTTELERRIANTVKLRLIQ
ncbi:MAG TPA: hypothetical protein VF746_17070 [Longimicrobium sp.]|jgi:hypothetical protein